MQNCAHIIFIVGFFMFFESIWDRTTKHMQTPQNCGNFGNLTSCIDSQWGLNLTNSENQRAQLANRIWSIRVRDLSVLVKCFVRGDVSLKFNNITGHSSRSIQSLELAAAVGFFLCSTCKKGRPPPNQHRKASGSSCLPTKWWASKISNLSTHSKAGLNHQVCEFSVFWR